MKKFYVRKEKKVKNNYLILNNLLKSKSHIGNSINKTHVKSFDYLTGIRKNQSIINLDITIQSLLRVFEFLKKMFTTYSNKPRVIILVANDIKTNYLINEILNLTETISYFEKKKIYFMCVNKKWIGGSLTNPWSKKQFKNYIIKPTLIISFNTTVNDISIREASICKIPIISFINTNINPDLMDYPVLFNNNNIKSNFFIIKLFKNYLTYLVNLEKNVQFTKKI